MPYKQMGTSSDDVRVSKRRHSGPQDPHIDNLTLKGPGGTQCTVPSFQTSVLYLSVPQV
jgi:hypothetical protein